MACIVFPASLLLATAIGGAGVAEQRPEAAIAEMTVVDKATGKPVPCRIHLNDAAGKPQRSANLPFWHDHFVCPGEVRLELPPGKYRYEVERGPEYGLLTGSFTLQENATEKFTVQLERLVDLAAEGWWSGDLHVHRLRRALRSSLPARSGNPHFRGGS